MITHGVIGVVEPFKFSLDDGEFGFFAHRVVDGGEAAQMRQQLFVGGFEFRGKVEFVDESVDQLLKVKRIYSIPSHLTFILLYWTIRPLCTIE